MTIRNFCVARGTAVAGQNTLLYTVPPQHTFILKNVLMGNLAAVVAHQELFLQGEEGHRSWLIVEETPAGTQVVWEGWTVLNDGDTIHIYTAGGDANYWVAGALLPLATGQTAPVFASPGKTAAPGGAVAVHYLPDRQPSSLTLNG